MTVDAAASTQLERDKLELESRKLALEEQRFARESSWKYRLLQGAQTGIAAAIPLIVAVVALLGTLSTGALESETNQRLRAAELVLADAAPLEVSRRIAIVSKLMPEVRDDLSSLVDLDAYEAYVASQLSQGYQLYWAADEARLAFFEAASAKAGCAEEVAELWRLMFGPGRVNDVTEAPGYEWIEEIDLSGVCPEGPTRGD